MDEGEIYAQQIHDERMAVRRERDTLRQRVAKLEAEIAAIVGKLPETADGVPVVPGMDVWLPTGAAYQSGNVLVVHRGVGHHIIQWVAVEVIAVHADLATETRFPARECYSTREAAEAAGIDKIIEGLYDSHSGHQGRRS